MKFVWTLLVILAFICHGVCYSQHISKATKERHARVRKNSKGLSLKIKNLTPIDKNGKVRWTVKATLKNRSRDTLFYFFTPDCYAVNFLVMAMDDSITLHADPERCGNKQAIVIAIPPGGHRTDDIEIIPDQPVSSSFKFVLFLSAYKAKNMEERISDIGYYDSLQKEGNRKIWLQSNKVKT